MTTRIQPLTRHQHSLLVQNEASLPKQEEAPPSTSNAQDEQAILKAEFETLQRAYSETINRTNSYRDAGRADLENCAAYDRLVDFTKKHPELNLHLLLPWNPIASSSSPGGDGCSIS